MQAGQSNYVAAELMLREAESLGLVATISRYRRDGDDITRIQVYTPDNTPVGHIHLARRMGIRQTPVLVGQGDWGRRFVGQVYRPIWMADVAAIRKQFQVKNPYFPF